MQQNSDKAVYFGSRSVPCLRFITEQKLLITLILISCPLSPPPHPTPTVLPPRRVSLKCKVLSPHFELRKQCSCGGAYLPHVTSFKQTWIRLPQYSREKYFPEKEVPVFIKQLVRLLVIRAAPSSAARSLQLSGYQQLQKNQNPNKMMQMFLCTYFQTANASRKTKQVLLKLCRVFCDYVVTVLKCFLFSFSVSVADTILNSCRRIFKRVLKLFFLSCLGGSLKASDH